MKRFFLISIWVFAVIMFFVSLFPINKVYLWDEAVYLSSAENLFNSDPYYTEIAYRPVLLPFLIKLGSLVFNINLVAHVLVSLFFGLGIIGVYLLGKELFNDEVGFIGGIIFGLCPFLLHASTKIMTDVPSVSLLVLSFFFLFRYFRKDDRLYLYLSSFIFGLSIMMRFTSIIFALLIVIIFIFYKKEKALIFMYGVGVLITLLPYLIWAQIKFGFALLPFFKAQTIIAGSGLIADGFYYIKAIYSVGGLIAVVGLLFYLVSLRNFKKKYFLKKDLIVILWFLFFIIYLTLNPHKELRYLIPAVPALYLLSSVGFNQFKNKWLKVVMGLLVIGLLVFPLHNMPYFDGRRDFGEEFLLGRTKNLIEVIDYIKDKPGVLYSHSSYPVIAYYSKRKTTPTWPWDDRFYTQFHKIMENDGLYIHYKNVNKEPKQEWLDSNEQFRKLKEIGDIVIYEYSTKDKNNIGGIVKEDYIELIDWKEI